MLEGLLIACRVVGIDAAWIYLRDEYHGLRARLEAELAALQADPPVACLPRIELRRGAGAYICGEESAMIESIEGKRGMPRLRPPYVAEVGLFGRPTLVHNGETLAWVRDLVEQGPEAFAAQGRHGRRGLRRFSVSGRVREPGVKLAPAGITLRELVDEFCGGLPEGHTLYGYLPGGASGGILPASLADVPLDFDTLQPHGAFIGSAAIVVLTTSAAHTDRAVDAARNLMRFFEHESCGQCTPCRVGTAKASQLIAADTWDAPLLDDLAAVMRDASICGLGQAAPNVFEHVLRYFPQELAGAQAAGAGRMARPAMPNPETAR
jgi:formate dehydrogenase